jgi:hypothetical protein
VALGYHVFIQGPQLAGNMPAVAKAIAGRYGLDATAIVQRVARGPIRVKNNVDLATAERFAGDLRGLGAVCAIVDATTGETLAETPAAAPPAAARPAPRPGTDASGYVSGLAAAFAAPAQPDARALGALAADTGATPSWALATIDGEVTSEAAAAGEPAAQDLAQGSGERPTLRTPQSEPPDRVAAGRLSFRPSAQTAAARPPERRASTAPADPFLPPEMSTPPPELVLARPAPADPFLPPEMSTPPPELVLARPGATSGAQPPVAAAVAAAATAATAAPRKNEPAWRPLLRKLASDERARLVAGLCLATLLGAVPAGLYAESRERSVFAELRHELQAEYRLATTVRAWEQLDQTRSSYLELMQSRRFHIALTAFLLWAGAGGALAYIWFRRIDWGRIRWELGPKRAAPQPATDTSRPG